MAIVEDAAVGPWFDSFTGGSLVSPTFSPGNNTIILLFCTLSNDKGATITTPTNSGTALTWTRIGTEQGAGVVTESVFYAKNTTAQSNITVTATHSAGSGGTFLGMQAKLVVLSGADMTSPIQAATLNGVQYGVAGFTTGSLTVANAGRMYLHVGNDAPGTVSSSDGTVTDFLSGSMFIGHSAVHKSVAAGTRTLNWASTNSTDLGYTAFVVVESAAPTITLAAIPSTSRVTPITLGLNVTLAAIPSTSRVTALALAYLISLAPIPSTSRVTPIRAYRTPTQFTCQGTPGDTVTDLGIGTFGNESNWVHEPAGGYMGGAWLISGGTNFGEFSTEQVFRGATSLKFHDDPATWDARWTVPDSTKHTVEDPNGFYQRVFLYMTGYTADDVIFWWTVDFDGGPTYDFTEIEGLVGEDGTPHPTHAGRPESYGGKPNQKYKPAVSIPTDQWVRMEVLFDPRGSSTIVRQRIYFDPNAPVDAYDLEVDVPANTRTTPATRVPYSPIFPADRITGTPYPAGETYIDVSTFDTSIFGSEAWYISHHAIAPLEYGWIGPLGDGVTLAPIPASSQTVAIAVGQGAVDLAPIAATSGAAQFTLTPSLTLNPIGATSRCYSIRAYTPGATTRGVMRRRIRTAPNMRRRSP